MAYPIHLKIWHHMWMLSVRSTLLLNTLFIIKQNFEITVSYTYIFKSFSEWKPYDGQHCLYKVLFVSIWDKEKVLLNRTSWQYPLLHYLGTSVTSHMIFSDNFETPDVLIMSYHLSNEYNYLISHFMLNVHSCIDANQKKIANSTTMDFFWSIPVSVQVSRDISFNN